jgi:phosphatidylserine/phosphatidylglycerophosphate/cardiolipin synthase-like enzyme
VPFSIRQIYDTLVGIDSRGDGTFYSYTETNAIEGFLDTPQLWGHDPAVTDYVPAAGNLRTAISAVVASARRSVDLAVLFPFPDGLFEEALEEGFRNVDPSSNLVVRITAGYYFPIPPTSPEIEPTAEIDDFIRRLRLDPRHRLHVALQQTWATSWNHAKLVVADGRRAISGGHNLWSDDYTQFAPVHDVSFQFAGPAAKAAENFLNNMWRRGWYDPEAPRDNTPPLFWCRQRTADGTRWSDRVLLDNSPVDAGTVPMLSLARAGINLEPLFPIVQSDNASYFARVYAVGAMGGGHIRMSQQMLGGSPLGEYDMLLFPALCGHLLAGGELTLIISDTGATTVTHDSYSGDGIEATARAFASKVHELAPGLEKQQLVALLRAGLHIGPVRIRDKQPDYPAGEKWKWRNAEEALEPANHAKVMIFGDDGFYIGSDNAYMMPFNPFGMQEFGHMVQDAAQTARFRQQYWDKAWGYSSQFQVTDWEKVVNDVLREARRAETELRVRPT